MTFPQRVAHFASRIGQVLQNDRQPANGLTEADRIRTSTFECPVCEDRFTASGFLAHVCSRRKAS